MEWSRRLQPRAKVWLEVEGRLVFGAGTAALLKGIQEYGSLSRAAEELHMSYRGAWGILRKVERRLGVPLVSSRVGGEEGGGTALTQAGEELLVRFLQLQAQVEALTEGIFKGLFDAELSADGS